MEGERAGSTAAGPSSSSSFSSSSSTWCRRPIASPASCVAQPEELHRRPDPVESLRYREVAKRAFEVPVEQRIDGAPLGHGMALIH